MEAGVSRLTPREQAVLASWIRWGVYKLVAHELELGEQTVKNHATSIINKLDVRTFGQAAVIWDRAVRRYHVERRSGQRRSGQDRRATPG